MASNPGSMNRGGGMAYASVPLRPGAAGNAAVNRTPTALLLGAGCLVPTVLAYMLASGNENRVLAVVLALVGMLVIIARPFWGLILFIALLYTRPEESIPAIQGMRLPLMISLVTLVALIFHKLLNREAIVRSPLNGMVLGFGAAVVLSSLPNGNSVEAATDILKLVVLVLLVLNLASTPERFRSLVTALLTFTGYLAAYSVYLYLNGSAMAYQGMERSMATGIFSDPNDLACTIVAGLALVLVRIRQSTAGPRLFYIALTALLVTAILFTNSRGGMLAMLAVVGVFFLSLTRHKMVGLIAAGAVALVFLAVGPSRMTSFDSSESSANSRFWFWVNGVEQLIQHPVLGVGYQHFTSVNDGMTAHNSFVLCFAETGMVGYFFWLGCIYYSYRQRRPRPALPPTNTASIGKPNGKPALANKNKPATEITETIESTEISETARLDLFGTRLALAGFLVAAFFLSRTYVPVTFLLFSLPAAQQAAQSANPKGIASVSSQERQRDWGMIFACCLGSILFIWMIAMRLR